MSMTKALHAQATMTPRASDPLPSSSVDNAEAILAKALEQRAPRAVHVGQMHGQAHPVLHSLVGPSSPTYPVSSMPH